MKKSIIACAAVLTGTAAFAQSAVDAYRLSQPDMKGTARYMSMAGAFGALGGDLSVLSHNPGGIGVYRNSEVGFTLDLDVQHSESTSNMGKNGVDQTKFLLNNIGFVWTLRLPSSSCPNLNVGFTYNKNASFNRRYRGNINLSNSLSNYIAAVTTAGGYNADQLSGAGNDDPYNPSSGYGAPWLSILGYNSYLISSVSDNEFIGQWGSAYELDGSPAATSGTGYFDVQESGAIDSYNIALGGNIANVVFWGMDVDITHMNYNLTPQWSERLENAVVGDDYGDLWIMPARWALNNFYNCSGTGFNYKFGVIVKPIQEFRLGFSFETPTWYSLTETFNANVNYRYGDEQPEVSETNDGFPGTNDINFRTPWKINASAAAVLFNRLIISAEYEWTQYKGMKYSAPSYWGGDYWYPDYDPWYPWDYYSASPAAYDPYVSNDSFYYTNQDIKETYCNTNTLRLGAELRVLPQLSVRAGYSFVSSPVNTKVKNSMIETAGTIPNYRFDNTTNYITCGLGYRIKSFYIDLAYVYKHMTSEYHAYSPWYPQSVSNNQEMIPSPVSSLSLNNSQIVLSAGFKF